MSNIFPYPKRNKVFYFKNILQEFNRTQKDNFIIGGGLCVRQSDEYLGDVRMLFTFQYNIKYIAFYAFFILRFNFILNFIDLL